MTGKCYYLTSLENWRHHANRFANSHFVVLNKPGKNTSDSKNLETVDASAGQHALPNSLEAPNEGDGPAVKGNADSTARILVVIEADEGVHLMLEDQQGFEPLSHPLTQKRISENAQAELAPHGVEAGATTFDVTEALACVHPLLRHRVF